MFSFGHEKAKNKMTQYAISTVDHKRATCAHFISDLRFKHKIWRHGERI